MNDSIKAYWADFATECQHGDNAKARIVLAWLAIVASLTDSTRELLDRVSREESTTPAQLIARGIMAQVLLALGYDATTKWFNLGSAYDAASDTVRQPVCFHSKGGGVSHKVTRQTITTYASALARQDIGKALKAYYLLTGNAQAQELIALHAEYLKGNAERETFNAMLSNVALAGAYNKAYKTTLDCNVTIGKVEENNADNADNADNAHTDNAHTDNAQDLPHSAILAECDELLACLAERGKDAEKIASAFHAKLEKMLA
jgi:hypothetical protein